MAEEKIRLSVDIFGETYHMQATENQENMLKIVAFVNEMMHQVGDGQAQMSFKDVAVLAALNISERYFKLQEDYDLLLGLIEEEKS